MSYTNIHLRKDKENKEKKESKKKVRRKKKGKNWYMNWKGQSRNVIDKERILRVGRSQARPG